MSSKGASPPHLWAEANRYTIEWAGEHYVPHPDGPIQVTRSTLLIGHQGVGKTHAMKHLCYTLSQSTNVFPLYLDAGRAFTRFAAEDPPSETDGTLKPRQVMLRTCCEVLLCLELLRRAYRFADPESMENVMQDITGTRMDAAAFKRWRLSQHEPVRLAVERGRNLPTTQVRPNLPEVLNALSDNRSDNGQQLVILVDQADRVRPLAFSTILELLQPGDHVAVIATRPCPCAPFEVPRSEGMIVPAPVGLGTTRDVEAWRGFFAKIIDRSPVMAQQVKDILRGNIDTLAAMFPPSVRQIILLAAELTAAVESSRSYDDMFEVALKKHILSERSLSASAISGICNNKERVITDLRDRALSIRAEKGLPAGRVTLNLSGSGSINVPAAVQRLLRTFTREGIFIPAPGEPLTLDGIVQEYEISAIIAASETSRTYDSQPVSGDIAVAELDRLVRADSSWDRRRSSLFLCDCKRDREQRDIYENFVLSNMQQDVAHSVPQRPDFGAVSQAIRDAGLVAVDVANMTEQTYVELGLAAAVHKPWIGLSVDEDPSTAPIWLKPYIRTPVEQACLGIQDMLNRGTSQIERWERDSENRKLHLVPDGQFIALLGGGAHWTRVVEECQTACSDEFRLEATEITPSTDDKSAHFEVIRAARNAGTMVLVFTGSKATDGLLLLAAGAFLARESGQIKVASEASYQRRLFIVDSGKSRRTPPMVQALRPRVATLTEVSSLPAPFRAQLGALRNTAKRASRTPNSKKR